MKISNKTACAAALLAFTLPLSAQTWNVNGNGNWNVNGNWTPSGFPNAAGATANLTNDLTATSQITLGAPITVGTLNIGDANGTNAFVLTSGNSLTFQSATAGGDTALNVSTAGTSGNTIITNVNLGGTSNLTISALGTQSLAFHPAATLAVGSNTLTVNTVLTAPLAQSPYGKQFEIGGGFTGDGALVKNGVGGMEIQGASTFSGTVTINAGSINVRNTNGSLASTSFTVNANAGAGTNSTLGGSALAFGDSGLASVNRINDTASITLNGGSVLYSGSNSTGISSETIGSITANEGSSNIYLQRGGTLQSELYMSTLNRTAGATLQVRGTSLGSVAGTAGSTRVFISTAPTLSGAGGASGTTTMSILPWAYGGTGSGDNSDLVTYDATNGLRGLATGEYATNLTGGATNNVSVASVALGGSDRTVNGLKYTATGSTILGANTLNVTSGAVIFSGNNGAMAQGTLNFGSAEGVVTSIASYTNTITSVIAGSGGLTKGGTGTLILSGANTYTGTTTVAGGILRAGAANVFNDTAVVIANTTVNPIGTTTPRTTTLDLNGNNQNIKSLAGGGTFGGNVALGAAALTLDGTSGATTYGGIISGSGSLTKSGAGATQTLTGASTYTGATFLSNGTLIAANGKAFGETSALTLSGGTLDVRGAVANAVTLGSAADFTMSGGTINLQLATAFDSLVSSGAGIFTITGGTFALDVTGTGFDYANTYNVLAGFGGANTVSGLAFTGYDSGAYTANLSTGGVLSFGAIPEPSAALLGAIGALALLRRRRN